jgi:hypothetical protein
MTKRIQFTEEESNLILSAISPLHIDYPSLVGKIQRKFDLANVKQSLNLGISPNQLSLSPTSLGCTEKKVPERFKKLFKLSIERELTPEERIEYDSLTTDT